MKRSDINVYTINGKKVHMNMNKSGICYYRSGAGVEDVHKLLDKVYLRVSSKTDLKNEVDDNENSESINDAETKTNSKKNSAN